MQLNLTGHHVEITDALRQYVQKKLERVERHFDKVSNTHVILSVESLRHKAEATVNMSGNKLFAENTEDDMYAAIDGLMDKLDRQVSKHKQKITDHHKGRTEFPTEE